MADTKKDWVKIVLYIVTLGLVLFGAKIGITDIAGKLAETNKVYDQIETSPLLREDIDTPESAPS